MGNGIKLIYRHPELIHPSTFHSISIPMYEISWLRYDGRPATREHLLMTLADLDSILIKATYTGATSATRLVHFKADVSLSTAVDQLTDLSQALAVEQCRCPIGYTGLSCEDCDAGYTRSGAGLYLGLCEPCFCNSHSSDCDPDTGICKNYQRNTGGDFCEECLSGFVGDASGGTPNDCQPAIEPHCQCDSRGSLGLECDYKKNCPCKPNVQGRNCNCCKEGFFNLEARNPEGCAPCFCFGVTQHCSSSSYYRSQGDIMNITNDLSRKVTLLEERSTDGEFKVESAKKENAARQKELDLLTKELKESESKSHELTRQKDSLSEEEFQSKGDEKKEVSSATLDMPGVIEPWMHDSASGSSVPLDEEEIRMIDFLNQYLRPTTEGNDDLKKEYETFMTDFLNSPQKQFVKDALSKPTVGKKSIHVNNQVNIEDEGVNPRLSQTQNCLLKTK